MVLHFYQPPTQEDDITNNVLNFCYLPLLRMLVQKSGYGLTVNISGCLLLQLQKLGSGEFFELTKELIKEGKIEIINSVLDHPLMPVMESDVTLRQIKVNSKVLKELLGVSKTQGFFPPELAVDSPILDLIKSSYVVVDERALDKPDPIVKYHDKYLVVNNRAIGEIFRSYPDQLGVETVMERLQNGLTITANDAELFGHHYTERLQVLADLLSSSEVKFITVAEAIKRYGDVATTVTEIKPSTWQNNKGFDLWTRNRLQQKYLKLLQTVHAMKYNRELFDRATSSCYLYWLSNWPWWHPGLVEKGASNLIKSVKNAKAEAVYQDFIQSMWRYHKSGKVEMNYQKYGEVRKLDNDYKQL
ncbi:MAG: hypothetical protein UX21_C0005G0019 [Microgenomates group bacterium GW2011_GWC2_45_8]|nr:MAG: hypothetical protein UX21_C0005G0019 [Microgenomates group bacterium GW2011_GWC2_45_8]